MGIFSGWGEWKDAETPVRLEIKLTHSDTILIEEYTRDYVYYEGWFDMEGFGELMSKSASQRAERKATDIRQHGCRIRQHGCRHYDTHYPVHRIKEVQVVKCAWVEKEHEVTVKSWEIEPRR